MNCFPLVKWDVPERARQAALRGTPDSRALMCCRKTAHPRNQHSTHSGPSSSPGSLKWNKRLSWWESDESHTENRPIVSQISLLPSLLGESNYFYHVVPKEMRFVCTSSCTSSAQQKVLPVVCMEDAALALTLCLLLKYNSLSENCFLSQCSTNVPKWAIMKLREDGKLVRAVAQPRVRACAAVWDVLKRNAVIGALSYRCGADWGKQLQLMTETKRP